MGPGLEVKGDGRRVDGGTRDRRTGIPYVRLERGAPLLTLLPRTGTGTARTTRPRHLRRFPIRTRSTDAAPSEINQIYRREIVSGRAFVRIPGFSTSALDTPSRKRFIYRLTRVRFSITQFGRMETIRPLPNASFSIVRKYV